MSAKCIFIERVADWEDVRASSNNLSLFGSRKLIELRLPSGKPGTGGANAIVELLREPEPRQRLSHDHRQARTRAEQFRVGEGVRVRGRLAADAGRWRSRELPQWLRGRAPPMSLELDDDAVRFIVERPRAICSPRSRSSRSSSCTARQAHRSRRRAGVDRRQRAFRRVPARRSGARRRRAARAAHPLRPAQRRRRSRRSRCGR